MKREELTKTFVMSSNWKNFGLLAYIKIFLLLRDNVVNVVNVAIS